MKSKLTNTETKLPIAKLTVALILPTEIIYSAFRDVGEKLGFYIIDNGTYYSMAVHKPGFSLRRLFWCCPGLFGPENMTAIKILFETNKRHNKKVITVTGLSGVLLNLQCRIPYSSASS